MSGSPNLASIQGQWDNYLATLERLRRWGDGTLLTMLEQIEKNVEGDYTPQGQASFTATTRAAYSAMLTRARVAASMSNLIYEFGKLIGSPYRNLTAVFRDIYDYMIATPISVPSRNIAYGAPSAVGTPSGNGQVRRLTVDENGLALEACRPEKKRLVCRADQSSGVPRHAEVFEVHGTQPSIDALDLLAMGTGALGQVTCKHAGTGEGGSLLKNSSFSEFNATTGLFNGWDFLTAPTTAAQDTTNVYRTSPGTTVHASAALTGNFVMRQTIEAGPRTLRPGVPVFLRVMYNRDIGPVTAGTLTIRIGSKSTSVSLAAGTGWQELFMPLDQNLWFRNFNQEGLDVRIEVSGAVGDQLLIDDVLFSEWDLVDGTYLYVNGEDVPFLLDDEHEYTDTGGDPSAQGILNYWTYIAGYGYLPHSGTPTWADPSIP